MSTPRPTPVQPLPPRRPANAEALREGFRALRLRLEGLLETYAEPVDPLTPEGVAPPEAPAVPATDSATPGARTR